MGKLLAGFAGALVLVLLGCSEEAPAGPSSADLERERAELAQQIGKGKKNGKTRTAAKRTESKSGAAETSFSPADEAYVYDATDKRDPFRPFRFETLTVDQEIGGPLEQFELEQVEVVAIVWDAKHPRAMVTDPAGTTYVVAVGSRMGKNRGQVIHIGDNLVLVKETYVDFAGDQTTKDVELQVRQSQGG